MFHFFVSGEQIREDIIQIEGSDVRHIRSVLRMEKGEKVTVSSKMDGTQYLCEIDTIKENTVNCRILECRQQGTELPVRITLLQGLPKSDKMEWIIQKAVELGVCEVVPMAAKRSVVRLDHKKEEMKRKRWNAISESAAKQSKRSLIPQVREVMSFSEAVEYAAAFDVAVIPYEHARGMEHTRSILDSIQPGQSVAVMIGPEGGFEESEIEEAQRNGIKPITLGRRILRTETAGMTLLAAIMLKMDTDKIG